MPLSRSKANLPNPRMRSCRKPIASFFSCQQLSTHRRLYRCSYTGTSTTFISRSNGHLPLQAWADLRARRPWASARALLHACSSSVKTGKKKSASRVKDKGTKHVAECRLSVPLFLAPLYNFWQTLLDRLVGGIRLAVGPGML